MLDLEEGHTTKGIGYSSDPPVLYVIQPRVYTN